VLLPLFERWCPEALQCFESEVVDLPRVQVRTHIGPPPVETELAMQHEESFLGAIQQFARAFFSQSFKHKELLAAFAEYGEEDLNGVGMCRHRILMDVDGFSINQRLRIHTLWHYQQGMVA